MSRSHLPIGTWGNVRSRAERKDDKGKVVAWRAAAYFRDHDRHVREVTAFVTDCLRGRDGRCTTEWAASSPPLPSASQP